MDSEVSLMEYVKDKVSDILAKEGIDLVEFKMFRQGSSWVIRSLVDYPQGGIDIERCANINRIISQTLENDKNFPDSFIVEVNSPGVDRPLRTASDFVRVKGSDVQVWFNIPFKEKMYVEGELVDVDKDEDKVAIKVKEEIWHIPLKNIKTAKQRVRI